MIITTQLAKQELDFAAIYIADTTNIKIKNSGLLME